MIIKHVGNFCRRNGNGRLIANKFMEVEYSCYGIANQVIFSANVKWKVMVIKLALAHATTDNGIIKLLDQLMYNFKENYSKFTFAYRSVIEQCTRCKYLLCFNENPYVYTIHILYAYVIERSDSYKFKINIDFMKVLSADCFFHQFMQCKLTRLYLCIVIIVIISIIHYHY